MKFELYKFKSLTSTNDQAIYFIKNKNIEFGYIHADYQTSGRGTYGKKWISKKDNMFGSLFFPLKDTYPTFREFSFISPIVICDAIKSFCSNCNLSLKWPNDILFHGKKTGGILCESKISGQSVQSMVVGMGINVNETEIDFPDELKETATSLSMESGHTHQRELVAAIFTTFFEQYWERLQESPEEIINDWTSLCGHLGKSVSFNFKGENLSGIFKIIDQNGHACITIGSDEKVYPSIILE